MEELLVTFPSFYTPVHTSISFILSFVHFHSLVANITTRNIQKLRTQIGFDCHGHDR